MINKATTWLEHALSSNIARLVVSFAISAAMCLFLAMCVVATNSDDDWSISFYLSGRLSGSGLSLFVNALLSRFIYMLNCAFPAFNWFFLIEYVSTFLAFAALIYAILTYTRTLSGFFMLALIVWRILPNCIASSNYTYVAFFATCAGGFLLVARLGSDHAGVSSIVCGTLLVLLGMLWRFQMFLVGVPFIGIAYLWVGWPKMRAMGIRGATKVLAPAFVCLLVCLIAYVGDIALWGQSGWREWHTYNAPRTITSDYPMPDYGDVSAELTQMGVSENDYWMIRNWANADSDVLNTDLLKNVAALQKELPSIEEAFPMILDYAKSLASRWAILLLVLLCLVFLGLTDKHGYLLVFLELVLAFVVCSYYVLIERLIDRVEDPTWFYAICLCVAMDARCVMRVIEAEGASGKPVLDTMTVSLTTENSSQRALAKCLAGLAVFIAFAVLVIYKNLPNFSISAFAQSLNQESYVSQGAISQYAVANPDTVYVIESGLHTAYEREYEYRYLPAAELAERVMPLGGWGSGSPFRVSQAERVGATNPVQALITSESTRLIAGQDVASHVLLFIQEHYDSEAQLIVDDTLEWLGEGVCSWVIASA